MKREEAIKRLNELAPGDIEQAHVDADWILRDVLVELGYGDVVEAYDAAADRLGFYYA
jgi:hypothetical protein